MLGADHPRGLLKYAEIRTIEPRSIRFGSSLFAMQSPLTRYKVPPVSSQPNLASLRSMSGFRQKDLNVQQPPSWIKPVLNNIEAGFRGLWQIVLSGCACSFAGAWTELLTATALRLGRHRQALIRWWAGLDGSWCANNSHRTGCWPVSISDADIMYQAPCIKDILVSSAIQA